MENQNQNQRVLEEIDLLEFTIKAAKVVGDYLFKILRLALRKIVWIMLFSIIGFILGYNKYKSTTNTYFSEIIVRSNAIDNYFIINSINTFFESNNDSFLIDSIGFTSAQANTIISVKAEYGLDFNDDKNIDSFNERFDPKDTLVERLTDVFKIKVLVSDFSTIPTLQLKLINYFNVDSFISKSNKLRLKSINSRIELIKKEIDKLNDLKIGATLQQNKSIKDDVAQIVQDTEQVQQSINSSIIVLNDQKLALEKELAINHDPLAVIQDFSPSKQISGKKISTIRNRIIGYAILGFLISLLWQYRTSIWLKLRKNDN